MRFNQLMEATKILDFRMTEMPDLPFYPKGEDPQFMSPTAGFHFAYHAGVLMVNSTSNAFYDAKATGGDEKAASKMWNQLGGVVDFSTSTITIAKESVESKSRQRTVANTREAKKAIRELMKFGVKGNFKIKGWSRGVETVDAFLSSVEAVEQIKSNTSAPIILYHGTSSKAYDIIAIDGLRPGKTEGTYVDLVPGYSENNVYLSTEIKTAEFYGKRQAKKDGSTSYVILQVTVPDAAKLLPDDSVVGRGMDTTDTVEMHRRLKISASEDGSVAYRGAIRPAFIALKATRKA